METVDLSRKGWAVAPGTTAIRARSTVDGNINHWDKQGKEKGLAEPVIQVGHHSESPPTKKVDIAGQVIGQWRILDTRKVNLKFLIGTLITSLT